MVWVSPSCVVGCVVVGADLVVGYLFSWLVRKAKRVGTCADERIDQALDAGVDRAGERLHELVAGRLHGDPAFERLSVEAGQRLKEPTPRTAQRVTLALEDAAEQDPGFADAVDALVAILAAGSAVAGAGGLAVAGPMQVHAEGASIAAGVVNGGARITNPPVPGPPRE
jgi:hypothetical protein